MSINQLRGFHYVAIHGGFSRAAEMLNITQPAISDQVRKLELAFDLLLFDRSKKQIALTPIGKRLLKVTKRLFEIENQALELLNEHRTVIEGNLTLIVDSALHLSGAIGLYRAQNPGIRLTVRSGNSQEVMTALRDYSAEVGILGEKPKDKDLRIMPLSRTSLVAFVANDSTLIQADTIKLATLCELPVVMRERGSKTRATFKSAIRKAGLKLKNVIEVEGRDAVREIVASGVGIGLVSESEFGHDRRLRKVTILDTDLVMKETLVCLKERADMRRIALFFDTAMAVRDDNDLEN